MKKFFNSTVVQTILTIIISFLLLHVGETLGIPVYWFAIKTGNRAIAFMGMYALFIGVWVVTIILWAIIKKYRCLFGILGSKPKGNAAGKSLLIGLVFGLGTNLLLACMAMLCGDIKLTFNKINIGYIVGLLITVCIQSGAEEIVMRGHMYQNLRRLFPDFPVAAIAGNALLFALFHAKNPGVTVPALLNIFLSGVMLSLIVYYFDSFWGAVFAHTGWNFCQSILLGLPNSGYVSEYSVFRLDAASARDSFAYNVNFGIEGTIASVILLALACAAILIMGRKRNRKPFDPWAPEEVTEAVTEQMTQTVTAEINNEQKETEE